MTARTRTAKVYAAALKTAARRQQRKFLPKRLRESAVELVEAHIRECGHEPGFDYAQAIVKLEEEAGFVLEDIAAACEVSRSTVVDWKTKGAMPEHASGERLYILFVETWERLHGPPPASDKWRPPLKAYKTR